MVALVALFRKYYFGNHRFPRTIKNAYRAIRDTFCALAIADCE
ncbi:MAG: hypothetical protein OCU20_02965 [Methanophagales archaeon]|nr:hypothetical protein [Methanophagales archaeon]